MMRSLDSITRSTSDVVETFRIVIKKCFEPFCFFVAVSAYGPHKLNCLCGTALTSTSKSEGDEVIWITLQSANDLKPGPSPEVVTSRLNVA